MIPSCAVLQPAAMHWAVSHFRIPLCEAPCHAVSCHVVLHQIVWCCVVLWCAVLRCAVPQCTALHHVTVHWWLCSCCWCCWWCCCHQWWWWYCCCHWCWPECGVAPLLPHLRSLAARGAHQGINDHLDAGTEHIITTNRCKKAAHSSHPAGSRASHTSRPASVPLLYQLHQPASEGH